MFTLYVLDRQHQAPFLPLVPTCYHQGLAEGDYHLIGAQEDFAAVGALVFHCLNQKAMVEFISVSPQSRGHRIGLQMLRFFTAQREKLGWEDLYVFLSEEDLPRCTSVLRQTGFAQEDANQVTSFTLEAFRRSPLLATAFQQNHLQRWVPLEEMSRLNLRYFNHQMVDSGLMSSPLRWESLHPRYSRFSLTEDTVDCALCVSQTTDCFHIQWLYAEGSALKRLLQMIADVTSLAMEEQGEDCQVMALTGTESSFKLMEKLLPQDSQKHQQAHYVYRFQG